MKIEFLNRNEGKMKENERKKEEKIKVIEKKYVNLVFKLFAHF